MAAGNSDSEVPFKLLSGIRRDLFFIDPCNPAVIYHDFSVFYKIIKKVLTNEITYAIMLPETRERTIDHRR